MILNHDRNDVLTMLMTELKASPEDAMGKSFHDETWQEIFTHCLEHDPVGLPWCTRREK